MNNFQRKIGPKLGEKNNVILNNEFKPRLYEDQINFDQMRMYRLNRVKKQLIKNDTVSYTHLTLPTILLV